MFFNQIDLKKFPELLQFIQFTSEMTKTDYNSMEILCYPFNKEMDYLPRIPKHYDGFQIKYGTAITAIAFGDSNSPIFIKKDSTQTTLLLSHYNMVILFNF